MVTYVTEMWNYDSDWRTTPRTLKNWIIQVLSFFVSG